MIYYIYLWNLNTILMMLITSSLFTNNWITLWMLIEMINTLITSTLNSNKENTLKFYLFQTLTSLMMMMFIVSNNLMFLKNNSSFLFLIIWIKLNMFPFHQWILSLNKSLTWNQFITTNIINKIPPMIMMSLSLNIHLINSTLTIMMMSWINFNLINIKMIISMISISNIQWFLLISFLNTKMTFMTLSMYFILNIYLINKLKQNKSIFLNQIMNNPLSANLTIMLTLMNLMSIPPLFMFLIKWFLIKHFVINKLWFSLMIMMNILNNFIMLKMLAKTMLTINNNISWFNKTKTLNPWWSINNWTLMNLI